MDKILTISIAAYNVEKFLFETLSSLKCKNIDKLEVIIVNDGSKDGTLDVANSFVESYPNTFKLVNKENGGYGSTINKGIEFATGKYFKQLDGDDKFDTENLDKFIEELEKIDVDIAYTPFYYWTDDKLTPVYCGLEDKSATNNSLDEYLKDFNGYLQMHSLAFRTSLLKDNGIKILENCFYTDTEYALYPFKYAKTAKFFDFPLYLYRIGLEGQSVSQTGVRKHFKDYEKVINSILDNTTCYNEIKEENVKKFILRKVDDVFYSSIVNMLKFLPYGYKTYKYIKSVDKTIKEKNPVFYVDLKKKTLKTFRKGKFITYTLLKLVLKTRYILLKK